MAYITESEVLKRASINLDPIQKNESQISLEAASTERFDVFLSHSSLEPEKIIIGVKGFLEDAGLTVYVDKYNDPQISPDKVTIETAKILRSRMMQSSTLLYIYSRHSKNSRWMPWELGYFDGLRGMVGIFPVTQQQEERFKGEEYLSLYPYIDVAPTTGESKNRFWINQSVSEYARLDLWIKGKESIRSRN